MVIVFPRTLRTSAGNLLWVAQHVAQCGSMQTTPEVVFDFSQLQDFDVNLCAALGVIVNRWRKENRRVGVRMNAQPVLSTLKQNGFLRELTIPYAWYNYLPGLAPDRNIFFEDAESKVYPLPYRKIGHADNDAQAKYVTEIFNEQWWPRMTTAVRDALASCILEVFNNAVEHSESEDGFFVCGHVGKSGQKQLRISIADAGIGFRAKIEKVMKIKMTSSAAIAWGMTEGNTVRQGIPGGQGLKILKEFISKNDGKLSVLSDQGYWEWSSGRERTREFTCSFPGTVVTIVINMDDPKSYRMSSEVEN